MADTLQYTSLHRSDKYLRAFLLFDSNTVFAIYLEYYLNHLLIKKKIDASHPGKNFMQIMVELSERPRARPIHCLIRCLNFKNAGKNLPVQLYPCWKCH